MNAILNYINDALEELHHIRWPTRHQAIRLSIIVLGFTAFMSAAFGAIDYALSLLVKFLLSFTA